MAQPSHRYPFWIRILIVLLFAPVAIWVFYQSQFEENYQPAPMTFNGNSTSLSKTVIVPTLEAPLIPGSSVLWAVSFQKAWSDLKGAISEEKVEISDPPPEVDWLNRSNLKLDVMDSNLCYGAVGFANSSFAARIRNDMSGQFKDDPRFSFGPDSNNIALFGYINLEPLFLVPFFTIPEGINFQGVFGEPRLVQAFGIPPQETGISHQGARQQISILWVNEESSRPKKFILDLTANSPIYQVILARIESDDTLKQCLEKVETLIKNSSPQPLGEHDVLAIPNIHCSIDHHFKELEGEKILIQNAKFQGASVESARLMLHLRLDRGGSQVASSTWFHKPSVERSFICEGPFLLVVKQRIERLPLLVMWIENPELLIPAYLASGPNSYYQVEEK